MFVKYETNLKRISVGFDSKGKNDVRMAKTEKEIEF